MTELPDGVLRVQRLGEDGNPVGAVSVFGVASAGVSTAIQDAALRMDVPLTHMAEVVHSWSMAVTNLDPELLRVLTGWKPRRGWKGHGAPPIYPRSGGRRG